MRQLCDSNLLNLQDQLYRLQKECRDIQQEYNILEAGLNAPTLQLIRDYWNWFNVFYTPQKISLKNVDFRVQFEFLKTKNPLLEYDSRLEAHIQRYRNLFPDIHMLLPELRVNDTSYSALDLYAIYDYDGFAYIYFLKHQCGLSWGEVHEMFQFMAGSTNLKDLLVREIDILNLRCQTYQERLDLLKNTESIVILQQKQEKELELLRSAGLN